jgi:hypothetical protein
MFHPVGRRLERGWPGRIDGDQVVQLAAQTLQAFFTGGGKAREHALYPLAEMQLLAPVLHPPAVRVFEEQRSFAFANPAAVCGPGASVRKPPSDTVSQGVLALLPRMVGVIGRKGELAGITLLAEWRDSGREPPKDRDFALGLGPLVVTVDELDLDRLAAVVRVDGEERLRGLFAGFDWAAARDLAEKGTRLYPGDLLAGPALGTVAVEPGSSIELDVDGIGVLAQSVGS